MNTTDPARRQVTQTGEPEKVRPEVSPHALTAINMLNLGILVIDRDSRITFANCAAEDLLQCHKWASVHIQSPVDAHQNAGALDWRLRQAISSPDDAGDRPILFRAASGNPLIVLMFPCRSDAADSAGGSNTVLFISDPNAEPDVDVRSIARLYGLTRAEMRLLEALLKGHRIGDYAKQTNITQNTVKGHLKQLFSKTQTSRQSELMLRVLATPVFRLVSTKPTHRSAEQAGSP